MAHAVVRAALAVAVKQGKLTRNPTASCVLPAKAHTERPRLTQEQAAAFLTAGEGDPLHAFFVLALATACRPAELFGLQWGDLRGDVLTIRRSVAIDEEDEKVLADTKTGRVRQIPLAASVLAVLKRHRLVLGMPGEEALMFPNADGGTLDGHNVANRHLKPLLAKVGLPTALGALDPRGPAGSTPRSFRSSRGTRRSRRPMTPTSMRAQSQSAWRSRISVNSSPWVLERRCSANRS
jgi:integrase